MTLYERFKRMDADFSRLGLERGETRSGYFCTPKGAEVIGWAGVDGIHCCFVKGFGETVFTVSPMNTRVNYVKPVADTFEDFLRLLLACGGLDAVEQAWMWNRGEFDAFLETYPPNEGRRAVLDVLRDELGLTPMDDPYGYIKGVQSSFDYGRLSFPEEYYELVPDEPEAQTPPERPEWKVYFADGFNTHHVGHDRPGREIRVDRSFDWGGNVWHVPAVYVCGKGLVADLCMEVEPDTLRAFIGKWENTMDRRLTPEEMDEQMSENPTSVNYRIRAKVNGRELRRRSGNGFGWAPESCRPESERDSLQNWEAVWLMEHYGLDPEKGWLFNRDSFPWVTKSRPKLKTMSLALEQEKKAVPGPRFAVAGNGDCIPFIHPVTGERHVLRVVEYENQEIDMSRMGDEWEYPTNCTAMAYLVEPELPRDAMTVRDCEQGDSPRVKARPAGDGFAYLPTAVCSVGVIGGTDGPTAVILGNGKAGQARCAYSALRFEPAERIEWRMVFYQKTAEDIEIELELP